MNRQAIHYFTIPRATNVVSGRNDPLNPFIRALSVPPSS